MRLYEKMMKPCVLQIPTRSEDGEGGRITNWADGDSFSAAFGYFDTDSRGQEKEYADKLETVSDFAVITSKTLKYHDVFKRTDTGEIYRITSDAKSTPDIASFHFIRYSAEKWSVIL